MLNTIDRNFFESCYELQSIFPFVKNATLLRNGLNWNFQQMQSTACYENDSHFRVNTHAWAGQRPLDSCGLLNRINWGLLWDIKSSLWLSASVVIVRWDVTKPVLQKGATFQHVTEFEREKIFGLRKEGFSYRAIAARVQRNRSTVFVFGSNGPMKIGERKSGSGLWKVTSTRDDKHMLYMPLTDPITSSIQLAAHWTTAKCVSLSASS